MVLIKEKEKIGPRIVSPCEARMRTATVAARAKSAYKKSSITATAAMG